MWRAPNSIPICIQQDASLFISGVYLFILFISEVYLYLETALHVSGGTSTHHQKRQIAVTVCDKYQML
jgi:hypothetical protein